MKSRNSSAILAVGVIAFCWLAGEFLVQKQFPNQRIVGELVTALGFAAGLFILITSWIRSRRL